MKHAFPALVMFALFIASCRQSPPATPPPAAQAATPPPLFQQLPADSTGITFANMIVDTAEYNYFNMYYLYNGGGVAVGDINNDGLMDLFFTSNEFPCRLYLNLGNFHFKDITDSAGINTQGGWNNGCVIADVNGDSLADIYVCRAGYKNDERSRNLLFISQGNLKYKEMAKEYGLDDAGLSTSASFFDYDNDGDLDLYVMNYPIVDKDPYSFFFYHPTPADSINSDRLFENAGNKFINVSHRAGLAYEKGPGLGLVIADINQDGWQDIYVGNDWTQNDYIYINRHNKTFKDEVKTMMVKNSFFSMGVDIADINNDAHPDIMVNDMTPPGHYRRHTIINQSPIDYYLLETKYGKLWQYSRNMLQLNDGNGHFNEMGEMAGVAKTDWSWSTLMADFDNDGLKDIIVTNGNKRNIGQMDYEMLMGEEGMKPEFRHNKNTMVTQIPIYLLQKHIFRNSDGLRFEEVTDQWGLAQKINTQGAAYADLDNDGNIDLILNNTDTTASIYRNTGGEKPNSHLDIQIKGESKNTAGLGAKAWLHASGSMQYAEISNARGFQSSSQPVLHFGLASGTAIDSVVVVFPSLKYTVLKNVQPGARIILEEKDAQGKKYDYSKRDTVRHLVAEMPQALSPAFVHHESDFNDFKRDKIIPRMFSREGPCLSTGDLNGDGLDDLFAGGAAGQAGALYFQAKQGKLAAQPCPALQADAAHEDAASLIADLNGDGFNDIYAVSGSNEFEPGSAEYQDRLYLNNGKGSFTKCSACLPALLTSKGCIAANDIDGDGDLDLFIGGRTAPHSYGLIPESYLLQNDKGAFTDITDKVAPELRHPGMLTDAAFTDVDGDRKPELVISGDWMPVSIFKYDNGKFSNVTSASGLQPYTGWWNNVLSADADNDGDLDLLCGNWGLNSILKADSAEPLTLLVNDFDGNGSIDPVLCCYLEGELGTFLGRELLCKAMPMYYNKFHTYEKFARSSVDTLFSKELFDQAAKLYAGHLRTSLFINDGKGHFTYRALPQASQLAPVRAIIPADVNGDGVNDFILLGNTNANFYDQGNIDALTGCVLQNDGKGNLTAMPYPRHGLFLQKFVRSAAPIKLNGKSCWALGCNSDSLEIITLKAKY